MDQSAAQVLPAGMDYNWTGLSYQELLVGNQIYLIFGLSIFLVFLVLAPQYESWTDPTTVVHAAGKSIPDAVVEATQRRFRPILMTSIAFILGVVPLLTASGAGAASQQAIGTVVFGGMLASILLAIPFVSVFYVLVHELFERRRTSAVTDTAGDTRAAPTR